MSDTSKKNFQAVDFDSYAINGNTPLVGLDPPEETDVSNAGAKVGLNWQTGAVVVGAVLIFEGGKWAYARIAG